MSPSFIETRMNGRVYILMLEFIGGRVKTTSYRSSCDMPADVHTKYLAWMATRRVVAERDARFARTTYQQAR